MLTRRLASSATVVATSFAARWSIATSSSEQNPNGLPDPEWYAQQNAHILLHLSLVEEARQRWWHEVTRRLRDKNAGEDVDEQCAKTGESLLHVAALAGRRKLVEELLEMHGAAGTLRDRRGRTPLLCCAEHGSEVVAETLVTKGHADVNECDSSGANAMAIAARLGHVRLVRWLLTRKELREPLQRDVYGTHALHKAVSFGQIACVEALLADTRVKAKIDLPVGSIDHSVPSSYDAKSGGETALHLACGHTYWFHHKCHTRIAKLLVNAGADPNLRTGAEARTAVHCAAAAGNVGVLRMLLSSGRVADATWTARDGKGSTAQDLANGNREVLAVLAEARTGRRASPT